MARAIGKRIMLDLIIEAKKTDPETGPFSEWLAEYLVDHLPTLTPLNEWVSVETEMPPEDECVLCIVNGNPRSNITLEDAYQLGSWSKSDGWIIDEWPDWEGPMWCGGGPFPHRLRAARRREGRIHERIENLPMLRRSWIYH